MESLASSDNLKSLPFVYKKPSRFSILFVLALLLLPVRKYISFHIFPEGIGGSYRQLGVFFFMCLVVSGLLYLYLYRTYSYWFDLGVPCSKPFPIVGHTLRRFGISMHILEFYDDIYYNHNGRDFGGFYEFMKPGLVVGNLELIRNIVVKDFDHFANRRIFPLAKINPIADEMLPNATGEDWRRIKSAISPVFSSSKLRNIYPLVCRQAQDFAKLIANLGNHSQELEIRELCGQFAMDTIASCAFGIECDAMNSDRAMFATMASKIFVLSPARACKMITLLTAPFIANLVQNLGIDFTSEEFRFFDKAVRETIRMREENGIRRGDFLDLMKDTNKLSETTMTAQAVMFLLAGHNNIASALSFTLHLLAVNQRVQDELREELMNETARRPEEDIDCERLLKLTLLDCVVKESLRLYPGDPNLERICTKDYQIPGTRILIKEKQTILIPVWSIHRDPQHWPEPECFKPERFKHHDNKVFGPFLPFGIGPRQCIGIKFVNLVMKTSLQKLLCSFKVMPSENTIDPPPLSPKCFLSLMPQNGLPMKMLPLENHVKKLYKSSG